MNVQRVGLMHRGVTSSLTCWHLTKINNRSFNPGRTRVDPRTPPFPQLANEERGSDSVNHAALGLIKVLLYAQSEPGGGGPPKRHK